MSCVRQTCRLAVACPALLLRCCAR
jgi:hypothetical protein